MSKVEQKNVRGAVKGNKALADFCTNAGLSAKKMIRAANEIGDMTAMDIAKDVVRSMSRGGVAPAYVSRALR